MAELEAIPFGDTLDSTRYDVKLKEAVERNADTNAFTDTDKDKLNHLVQGEYYIANITPTGAGDEYPIAVPTTEGGYYYIDIPEGSPYTYVGGRLIGQVVYRGDRIMWTTVATVQGWYYLPVGGNAVEEAPEDELYYVRKDRTWKPSFFDTNFGTHDPSGGTEYPTIPNGMDGAYWMLPENGLPLNDHYTFLAGDLAGITVSVGQRIYWFNDYFTLLPINQDASSVLWKGTWVQTSYFAGNMVFDEGYLAVANKVTTDRAAPQLIGSATFIYDGTLTPVQEVAKQVIFGTRYNVQVNLQLSKYRIETVVGNVYSVYSITDPLSAKIITKLSEFTADINGWVEVSVTPTIILSGTVFDVVAVVQEPDPTPTIITANYNYLTPNNTGTPATGVIEHSNSSPTTLSISKTDNDAIDRSAMLLALTVGDFIETGAIKWAIQSINDAGTYVNFGISPGTQTSPDGVKVFNFETVTATPITLGVEIGYNTSNPNVKGLYGADVDYSSILANNNQYGIDIELQEIIKSDDWDIAATTTGISSTANLPTFYFDKNSAIILTDSPVLLCEIEVSIVKGTWTMAYAFEVEFNDNKDELVYFRLDTGMDGTVDTGSTFSLLADATSDLKNRLYGFPKELPAGTLKISFYMWKAATLLSATTNFVDITLSQRQ